MEKVSTVIKDEAIIDNTYCRIGHDLFKARVYAKPSDEVAQ